MLVLSRKETQSIKIGDQIQVTVSKIHGNRVCLAISAPPTVAIRREELAPLPAADLRRRGPLSVCSV
jgi:carbon storage regulator